MVKAGTGGGLRVLVLEPYYGGSHKSFLDGLRKLPFQFEFMTLPARKWKWRMRLSAPYYAERLHSLGRIYDRIICSTFVDVAAFRGLAPAWTREVPLLTYFHENQFAYPTRIDDERDFHFALTNITTALASDSLAFNSRYNLSTFLDGVDDLLRKSYDLQLEDARSIIGAKSRILPPGIDFKLIDEAGALPLDTNGPPVILWNHRWEHDKNPELFFSALFDLDKRGVEFRLIVLGESFREHPPVFEKARERLSHRILHFGYARSRREYAKWLRRGDIAVSTAAHEFFGISIIEAVRAGCRPLLPMRLSYPEIFPDGYLYHDNEFLVQLEKSIAGGERLSRDESLMLTKAFSREALSPHYENWITQPKNG